MRKIKNKSEKSNKHGENLQDLKKTVKNVLSKKIKLNCQINKFKKKKTRAK